MKKIILVLYAGFILSGCSVFNPYKSEFQCPDTYKGKCVSTTHAYKESIENSDNSLENLSPKLSGDLEYNYRTGLYNKLASLINKPTTPIVLPPKVMRTLILSYTGSANELYSYRYVYFFATEPKWIISTTKEIE
ncbi:conjugal transfer pilus assembly protein TraV (plasmid) [Desulfosarcina sp. BuS5]|uniref:TraV family lipoprotein n=1 Tax=Desulfosarcina sp. BuS5 TaxID=933262 RepID=UPI0004836130|nr:TraV family lipoprotein [Desulfosarcina sp. BuS5]WDN90997.1 conjugal transfer pilus assembly protein TraV [Desulfosarcina sp. BuS5]